MLSASHLCAADFVGFGAVPVMVLVLQALASQSGMVPVQGSTECNDVLTVEHRQKGRSVLAEALKASSVLRFIRKSLGSSAWCLPPSIPLEGSG